MVCENCGTEVKEGSTFCPRCGKTINSSDGVLPNGEVKNEDNTSDLMKAIIKTKINYYMPQFELIKNGNKGRTNWASFFFGFIHAGYRNMWREWISAVKIPLIAELVLMILAGITMFVHPMAGMIFYGLEAVVAIWLMIAQFLFAGKFNRVYMKHVQEKVSCKNEKPDPSIGRSRSICRRRKHRMVMHTPKRKARSPTIIYPNASLPPYILAAVSKPVQLSG